MFQDGNTRLRKRAIVVAQTNGWVADIHERRVEIEIRLSHCRVVRLSRINKTHQRKCATRRQEDRPLAWNWRLIAEESANERSVDFLSISPRGHFNDTAYVDSMSPRRTMMRYLYQLVDRPSRSNSRALARSFASMSSTFKDRARACARLCRGNPLADNGDGIKRKLRELRKMQCELAECSFADIAWRSTMIRVRSFMSRV